MHHEPKARRYTGPRSPHDRANPAYKAPPVDPKAVCACDHIAARHISGGCRAKLGAFLQCPCLGFSRRG